MNHNGPISVATALALALAGCDMNRWSEFGSETGLPAKISSSEMADLKEAPEAPVLPATRIAAARLFESTRYFDRAIEQYRKIIASDSKHTEAYHRLGLLQGRLGRFRDAEANLQKAIQLDPSSAPLRNNFAYLLMTQTRWPEAERELRRALMLDPEFVMARTNLGLVLCAQKKYDEALAEFRRVLPEPDAYYNLGVAYRAHRQWDDARRAFEHVLALQSNFLAARDQLRAVKRLEKRSKQLADELSKTPQAKEALASFSGNPSASGSPPDTGDVWAVNNEVPQSESGQSVPIASTDLNRDGYVDHADARFFADCFTGRGRPKAGHCAAADWDQDGDVDLQDFQLFQLEFGD